MIYSWDESSQSFELEGVLACLPFAGSADVVVTVVEAAVSSRLQLELFTVACGLLFVAEAVLVPLVLSDFLAHGVLVVVVEDLHWLLLVLVLELVTEALTDFLEFVDCGALATVGGNGVQLLLNALFCDLLEAVDDACAAGCTIGPLKVVSRCLGSRGVRLGGLGVHADPVLLSVLLALLRLLSQLAKLLRGQEALGLSRYRRLTVLPCAQVWALVSSWMHDVLAGLDLLYRVRSVGDEHGLGGICAIRPWAHRVL